MFRVHLFLSLRASYLHPLVLCSRRKPVLRSLFFVSSCLDSPIAGNVGYERCFCVEEHSFDLLKVVDRHAREEYFQVVAVTLQVKETKVRECDVRHDWRTRHLLLNVIIENGRAEVDLEHLWPRNE